MVNKIVYVLLLLLPCVVAAQEPRKILQGRVVSDSLEVESISVLNISTNIGAITDNRGNFNIYARPADTLFFSSITFRPAKLVLTEAHFLEEKLLIKLDINITELDEIVITPLTGDLNKDSKKTKIKPLGSQFDSGSIAKNYTYVFKNDENINTVWEPAGTTRGINFTRVFEMLFKPKKSKKPEEDAYIRRQSFAEGASQRFTYHFFTETLKIPHDEIGLFLNFCDNGYEAAMLLDPKHEFELTDYLITKSAEYLKKEK